MNMRSYIFRAALLFVLVCGAGAVSASSPVVPETAPAASETASKPATRQERSMERRTRAWNSLIPRYSKVQYAGGMGMISAGPGWDYGRKRQWETEVFVGILPKFSGGRTTATLTLKQNYTPWSIPLGGGFAFEPFETGIYVNKVLSRNFWGREPEKYGGKYYKFMTNTRLNFCVGQRWKMDMNERSSIRSMSFFYEVSSNDLYIISKVNNKTLKPSEYLVFSVGLRFQFL